jgi:shikimate dehydrogenase
MKKAQLKKACVIGWPIAHSRSPLIHNFWLKKYGIEGRYTKEAVKPEDLETFLRSLASNGFAGCNVTVPHKEAAYHLTAKLGGLLHGACSGVANTLWIAGDGRLHATSTDAAGFAAHLMQTVPDFSAKGRPVMILGAGGAAKSVFRSIPFASEMRIANRSLDRAADFARIYPANNVVVVPWDERSRQLKDCALLVNTTTLGMAGQPPLEIDLTALPPDAIVYDIVYVPLETPLLKAARERGLRTVDGLGMLLHQAVPGFLKWFGKKPEVTPELRALIEADIKGQA